MKAKNKFNLDNPEDQQSFELYTNSQNMVFAFWDIKKKKKQLEQRWEDVDISNKDIFDGIEEVYEKIYEILGEYNLNIDKLIN